MIKTGIDRIADIVAGVLTTASSGDIERVSVDSRGVSPGTLFVALNGQRTDGHRFVGDAFRNGATAALVSSARITDVDRRPEWPIIIVPSPLHGLQELAKWHRRIAFNQVVAITGSNGKTIVKDALVRLLIERSVAASPGSYNSQMGLPLAILGPERRSIFAVLEAGVSQPGEMSVLEAIAQPDYGVLTNVGMAHFAAFGSRAAIAQEKMGLFKQIGKTGWVLLPADEPLVRELAPQLSCAVHYIGENSDLLSLSPASYIDDGQVLRMAFSSCNKYEIRVSTRSPHIISDLSFAASAAFLLGVSPDSIAQALDGYSPTPTRMELWSSPEGIRILNDAHSSDPISVNAALRAAAMVGPKAARKIFAFGGMREMGSETENAHRQVGMQAAENGFTHLLLMGSGELESTADGYRNVSPEGYVRMASNAEILRDELLNILRPGDTVLFKGPRNSGMARAARDLSASIAQRSLWVDLAVIAGNVAVFRRHCCGQARILAMLKALAYGTELVQLASWLSRLGIHHIGVSATSEGVAIRKTGVEQDIYVFLAAPDDVDNLVRYRLTPVVYSEKFAKAIAAALAGTGKRIDVHLKVDTGMHRLGVMPAMAAQIAAEIQGSGVLRLTGVCTHFSAADDPDSDGYTREQIRVFNQVLDELCAAGFDNLCIHAANTAATVRFPQAHYNMVRVGIGLYGLYSSDAVRHALELELAIAVTSRIASVRNCNAGEELGYGRTYIAPRQIRVGVVPFGYDDGLPWGLSGVGKVLVEGQTSSILGRISMDQILIDLTDVEGVEVGAEVLIYGSHGGHILRPERTAQQAGTIPHELLTRLGKRVHRIYLEP